MVVVLLLLLFMLPLLFLPLLVFAVTLIAPDMSTDIVDGVGALLFCLSGRLRGKKVCGSSHRAC